MPDAASARSKSSEKKKKKIQAQLGRISTLADFNLDTRSESILTSLVGRRVEILLLSSDEGIGTMEKFKFF